MMPAARTPVAPAADPRAELARQLKQAWVSAGRPTMGEVGDRVGYSKASISKVLSGKMAPAWHLVRKLGQALSVSPEVVKDVWHPLWADADHLRREQRPADPSRARHECAECGSWVADPQVHQFWHDAHQWAGLRDAVSRRTG